MILTDEELYKLWCSAIIDAERADPTAGDAHNHYAKAVIAANNAKVLGRMEPWKINGFGYAYSADQVAPLIQRVKELEGAVKQLWNTL